MIKSVYLVGCNLDAEFFIFLFLNTFSVFHLITIGTMTRHCGSNCNWRDWASVLLK